MAHTCNPSNYGMEIKISQEVIVILGYIPAQGLPKMYEILLQKTAVQEKSDGLGHTALQILLPGDQTYPQIHSKAAGKECQARRHPSMRLKFSQPPRIGYRSYSSGVCGDLW